MSQDTAFGAAQTVTYIKVQKADGRVLYFRVVDEKNEEISEATYLAEGGN